MRDDNYFLLNLEFRIFMIPIRRAYNHHFVHLSVKQTQKAYSKKIFSP